jgi:hypothetical protein
MPKFTVASRNMSIEIAEEDMLAILRAEAGRNAVPVALVTKLDDLGGVYDINYDGHFGPAIYCAIEFPEPKGLRKKIKDIIKAHVKECREWVATPPEEFEQRAKRVC